MSRKPVDDVIINKAARGMKAWPSRGLFQGPWEMLSKRLAKGIRLTPAPCHFHDPVYEATARALSNDRQKDHKDNG